MILKQMCIWLVFIQFYDLIVMYVLYILFVLCQLALFSYPDKDFPMHFPQL
jgi:hypothetical protein